MVCLLLGIKKHIVLKMFRYIHIKHTHINTSTKEMRTSRHTWIRITKYFEHGRILHMCLPRHQHCPASPYLHLLIVQPGTMDLLYICHNCSLPFTDGVLETSVNKISLNVLFRHYANFQIQCLFVFQADI